MYKGKNADVRYHINQVFLSSPKKERKLLQSFFICQIRRLFHAIYKCQNCHNMSLTMECCYMMDNKIIQQIIKEILESNEYTLEGIAYRTRIPLDVILDISYGNNTHLSITSWTKIMELYLEINPILFKTLTHTLITLSHENSSNLLFLFKAL